MVKFFGNCIMYVFCDDSGFDSFIKCFNFYKNRKKNRKIDKIKFQNQNYETVFSFLFCSNDSSLMHLIKKFTDSIEDDESINFFENKESFEKIVDSLFKKHKKNKKNECELCSCKYNNKWYEHCYPKMYFSNKETEFSNYFMQNWTKTKKIFSSFLNDEKINFFVFKVDWKEYFLNRSQRNDQEQDKFYHMAFVLGHFLQKIVFSLKLYKKDTPFNIFFDSNSFYRKSKEYDLALRLKKYLFFPNFLLRESQNLEPEVLQKAWEKYESGDAKKFWYSKIGRRLEIKTLYQIAFLDSKQNFTIWISDLLTKIFHHCQNNKDDFLDFGIKFLEFNDLLKKNYKSFKNIYFRK